MLHKKFADISRRDLMRVAGRYGMTSTLIAAAGMTGTVTLSGIARAAEQVSERRTRNPAAHTWRYGAAGFNPMNLLIQRTGCLEFVRDLEERTEGEIRIEFIGDNQICGQLDCVEQTQQGIVDLFTASTQNSAAGAPYYNILDFAYMFPSRAAQYYFLFHPESERILREPLRRNHGIHFLFSHAELRGIMLGLDYEDHDDIQTLEEIQGTTNRVTGTQLGRIAMQLLDLNPIPVAWEETLDGLRSGLIDGAETWPGAVAYAGMAPVVSQCVGLDFFSGFEHTAMNQDSFDALDGRLQDAVMESAYLTQNWILGAHEAALVNTIGRSNPQLPGTIFAENNTRWVPLSDEEKQKAAELCAPEYVPEPWEEWRERLMEMAGGIDTYTEIYEIAREIPADTAVENVEPRRWWNNA